MVSGEFRAASSISGSATAASPARPDTPITRNSTASGSSWRSFTGCCWLLVVLAVAASSPCLFGAFGHRRCKQQFQRPSANGVGSRNRDPVFQTSRRTPRGRADGMLVPAWCRRHGGGLARLREKPGGRRRSARGPWTCGGFLECSPMPLTGFGKALNAEASGEVFRGNSRALLGYSMGGRHGVARAVGEGSSVAGRRHRFRASGTGNEADALIDAPPMPNGRPAHSPETGRNFSPPGTPKPSSATRRCATAGLRPASIMRRREIARSFVDWSLGAQEPLWDRLR